MARRGDSRRVKERTDPLVKLERSIVPEPQMGKKLFVVVGVANHTEADQRAMVRSGSKQTLRRKTHIEKLVAAKMITAEQAPACQWYADQYEAGFQTVGCTANYGGAGGGGFGAHSLLARYQAQAVARDNYAFARSLIPAMILPLFERVVLHQHGLGPATGEGSRSTRYSRLSSSFRLAVIKLTEGAQHLFGDS